MSNICKILNAVKNYNKWYKKYNHYYFWHISFIILVALQWNYSDHQSTAVSKKSQSEKEWTPSGNWTHIVFASRNLVINISCYTNWATKGENITTTNNNNNSCSIHKNNNVVLTDWGQLKSLRDLIFC